eukprot:s4283_g7.t1
MGEALGEVFSLSASEGETAKQWTARVRETFDRCKRRANTDFPGPARGWITLNCAGLTEEQKAIIKAKTQGSLEYDDVSKAFRSCFPMYKAGSRAKKPIGAMVVEDESNESDIDQFADVQAFLADHAVQHDSQDAVELSEGEAAEALAVSWKERRTEIAKTNQARRFTKSTSSGTMGSQRKAFRSEIDDLKKRTRCRKCGKLGHWARECRSSSTGGEVATGSSQSATAAGYVEVDEHVEHEITFMGSAAVLTAEDACAAGLVQSPGFGVVDTGCGKTLIGEDTLRQVDALLANHRRSGSERVSQSNTFRFGNGAVEHTDLVARIPVGIGKKTGLIEAAVIKGQAPLLLGRPTLQKLAMHLDFKTGILSALDGQVQVPMQCNLRDKSF